MLSLKKRYSPFTEKPAPYFFLLLPVFFVLRGLAQHFGYIPAGKALLLIFYYLLAELGLFLLFLFLFKDVRKSVFAAFVLFSIYLFFGVLYDALKQLFGQSFITRYTVLLPLLGLCFITLLLRLKKKTVGPKITLYLNTLFGVLILIDAGIVLYKINSEKTEDPKVTACLNCEKPDVYFILLDEYAGQPQLRDHFSFDNGAFLQQLTKRGFSVVSRSTSNYSTTPFSIASLLSMEYLDRSSYDYTDKNLNYCYKKIARSKVIKVFRALGYRFVNYSIFDLGDEPSLINKTFLKSGIDLITSQTLIERFKRDVYYNLLMQRFQHTKRYKNFVYSDLENNELLYRRTVAEAKAKSAYPKFVYTHLLMPHFPYYYDENGKPNTVQQLSAENMTNGNLYLKYLQYTNTKVLQLVDSIRLHASKPPIILLLSDHGYRYVGKMNEGVFSTLAAVCLPHKKYGLYYSTLSNVNQFAVLFNTLFRQRFPLQPDKSIE